MNNRAAWVDLFQGFLAFASIAFFFWSLRRRIVGLEGVVLEEKESGRPYALISMGSQKWRAIAADSDQLRPGERVVVLRIQGLQLAVVDRAPLHAEGDKTKVREFPILYE